jgi:hypothetical protein
MPYNDPILQGWIDHVRENHARDPRRPIDLTGRFVAPDPVFNTFTPERVLEHEQMMQRFEEWRAQQPRKSRIDRLLEDDGDDP